VLENFVFPWVLSKDSILETEASGLFALDHGVLAPTKMPETSI
jgi:hypothetical protein